MNTKGNEETGLPIEKHLSVEEFAKYEYLYPVLLDELQFRRTDFRSKVSNLHNRTGFIIAACAVLISVESAQGSLSTLGLWSLSLACLGAIVSLVTLIIPFGREKSMLDMEQVGLLNSKTVAMRDFWESSLGQLERDERRLYKLSLWLHSALFLLGFSILILALDTISS